MNKKKYWQSFGELQNTKAYQDRTLVKELKDDMLIGELQADTLEEKGTNRRDFLKYLGFASITAAIASSCETAVKKSIPFLNKPQNIIPGEATYYATTYSVDGEVIPVLAKVRDGRPIKIEGNDLSTIHKGATTARVQASVLGLYDTARLRNPLQKKGTSYEKVSNIQKMDIELRSQLQGKSIAFVTPSISSPSSLKAIEAFQKAFKVTHLQYDDISYAAILDANEKTYQQRLIPSYRFDNADVIVSIGADFLGTWLSPAAFSKQWSSKRKVSASNLTMSKHYHVESIMTLTGANADERVVIKPSEEPFFVLGLYQALLSQSIESLPLSNEMKSKIVELSRELRAHQNKALVVSGANDLQIQVLVNAINEYLGSRGNTIDWLHPSKTLVGSEQNIDALIDGLQAKTYDAVIFASGANPLYTHPRAAELKALLQSVLSVSLHTLLDETTQACTYIIPDNHYLEAWGDYQLKVGYYSFSQPTIQPLFDTRAWQESLLVWAQYQDTYEALMKSYWVSKLGSLYLYQKALQDGVYEDTKEQLNVKYSDAHTLSAMALLQNTSKSSAEAEVVFYQKVAIGSGAMANNPWLQEMPDPISKATWDNYAMISLPMAHQLGIEVDDDYEVEVTKPVLQLTIAGKKLEMPVLVIPGVHREVIGIAVGYGRTEMIGKTVHGVGKNVYPYLRVQGSYIQYHHTATGVQNTRETYPIAYTQTHNSYEGRNEVMKMFSLEEFAKHPKAILEEREEEYKKYKNNVVTEKEYVADGTLYPQHDNPGIKWGMSIDLNACSGCGACVVACNAENNISVVGKKQVLKAHEMHWMRIDRYFSGSPDNPEVVFQPMLCQHCDNAPCENVCPVAATNHSSEGYNQMTYNRCIGTRYCANNCPFKVRRFNWLDYNGADSFKDNQKPLVEEGALDEVVLEMNADLSRLVLNPDVTVRSRGVIEKCSFCVQRLQAGKIKAKKESRPLRDGDVKTACMQACPTDAIVFGNVHDKQSAITKLRTDTHKERVFYVLEQIHVLPNVNYLAKIRNARPVEGTPTQEHH